MNKNTKLKMRFNRPIDIIFRALILLTSFISGYIVLSYNTVQSSFVNLAIIVLAFDIFYIFYRLIFKGIFNDKKLVKWPIYIYRLFGVGVGVFVGWLVAETISTYVFYQYFAPAPNDQWLQNVGVGFGVAIISIIFFIYLGLEIADYAYTMVRNIELKAVSRGSNRVQLVGLSIYIILAILVSVMSLGAANIIIDNDNRYHHPAEYCNKGFTSEYAKYMCSSSN